MFHCMICFLNGYTFIFNYFLSFLLEMHIKCFNLCHFVNFFWLIQRFFPFPFPFIFIGLLFCLLAKIEIFYVGHRLGIFSFYEVFFLIFLPLSGNIWDKLPSIDRTTASPLIKQGIPLVTKLIWLNLHFTLT